MLISQLIQKLEKLKSEKGDLPVYTYTEFDFEIYPLETVSFRIVSDETECELKEGQPYVCVY